MADESKQPQPTASEAMFFFSIVKNMKTQADIDWVNVAEDRGFKNAEVAKVCSSLKAAELSSTLLRTLH